MLSVFMPTIRTHLLEKWYESLEQSCNRHPFEVLLCGPFGVPDVLKSKNNIKFIKDFGSPTRSAQLAAIEASQKYLYHVTDDILFYPNVVSNEIDRMEDNTITALTYTEGVGYSGDKLPPNYWYAPNAYPGWPGVNQSWGIGVHFMVDTELFKKYGGFDCRFDYLNHAGHDLLFRMQKDGVKYKVSQETASKADWMPGISGDHEAIYVAQTFHDDPLFKSIWITGRENLRVELDNWKDQPDLWITRFDSKEIEKYEDL